MRPVSGIEVRHERSCESKGWGDCGCQRAYQASVWDKRTKTRIRKTFPTLVAAKGWRFDFQIGLQRGLVRAPSRQTVVGALDDLIVGMRSGAIRKRGGDEYKPSAIRSYEATIESRLRREFGGMRLTDLTRRDVQLYAEDLLSEGLDPSTIRNTLMPLRVLYRRALQRGDVAINPTTDLELPAVTGKRDRVASPAEAASLIEALSDGDKALWATAFYGGPRAGEIQALGWEHVNLDANVLTIERSWDKVEGFIAPKSKKGVRTTPIASILRGHLLSHWMRRGRPTPGLVFGEGERPFHYWHTCRRAWKVWGDAGLERITLHECRHTFVTLMFEAGISLERIGDYVGHSSAYMTERYRHLLDGHEAEAAAKLDAYLGTVQAGRG